MRSYPALATIALALTFGTAASAATGLPSDWPMYQYKADHNAVFSGSNLTVSWQYDTKAKINGGLAVVDNVLYVDTFANELLALDSRTGRLKWKAKTANMLMSTPIVEENMAFVGSGHNGRLDRAGIKGYAYSTGPTSNETWGDPNGDDIYAFDLASGAQKWSFHTLGENMPSPAYANGALIFGNGDLHAYALSASNGVQLWKQPIEGVATMSSAATDSSMAFVGTCHDKPFRCFTQALDTKTGQMKWRAPYGNSDCSPTVANGVVFVSGIEEVRGPYEHAGHSIIAALDERNGHLRWSYSSAAGPFTAVGSSERAIAGTYYDGSYYTSLPSVNQFVALDARTGKIKWSFSSFGQIKMSSVVDQKGRLFVGDTAGLFYTLDAKTGRLLHARTFDASFATAPPVIVGSTLYVVNGTNVLAMPLDTD